MKIIFLKKAGRGVAKILITNKDETEVLVMSDFSKIISLGIGKKEKFNRRKLILAARKIICLSKSNKIKKIAVDFNDFPLLRPGIKNKEIAEILAINFEMANFEFVKYKSRPKEGFNFIEEIQIINGNNEEIKSGFRKGQIIGEEINGCRSLANTPGGEMTPTVLANEAKKVAGKYGVKVKVFNKKEIEKLKMGGVSGVSKGSSEEPKFIVMEYLKGGKEKPIVLVGKGVTFDSGGLNLKPSDSMLEMHMDMSGGAAVIHALSLAGRLKLKKNIIGLVPAVENMPSGESYRPGDILKTMSGKTIEVLNTDAEGRVILSDALTYAKKYNPRLVVDVATLTGAAMSALGLRASALFTKDEKLEKLFRELGEESGDYVWPLPLWEEYEEDIKGTFGDIINTGKTRYGGAILGAIFLYQFAKDYPWVHIDIAPRMTSIEGEYLSKGAIGTPVRLLIKLLEKF